MSSASSRWILSPQHIKLSLEWQAFGAETWMRTLLRKAVMVANENFLESKVGLHARFLAVSALSALHRIDALSRERALVLSSATPCISLIQVEKWKKNHSVVLDQLKMRDAEAADFRNLETVFIASKLSVFSIHDGDAGMYYSKESIAPLQSQLKTPSGMPDLDEAKDEVHEMQVEDQEPLRMRLSDQFMAHGDRTASSSSSNRPPSSSSNARPHTPSGADAGSRPHTPLGLDTVNLIGGEIDRDETAAAMASLGDTRGFHQQLRSRPGTAGRPMTVDCVPSMSHQTSEAQRKYLQGRHAARGAQLGGGRAWFEQRLSTASYDQRQ